MFAKIIYIAARVIAAVIMLQTLFYKFSGAKESIEIFTTVGMEPWGRYGVGVGELIASVLILIPKTAWIGGSMAAGLMAGAILMHVLFLGVEVQGDGGLLFMYALAVLFCGAYVMHVNRLKINEVISGLIGKK